MEQSSDSTQQSVWDLSELDVGLEQIKTSLALGTNPPFAVNGPEVKLAA